MKTQQQIDNDTFEFWKNMFRPRTEAWQKQHLKMLRKRESTLLMTETEIIHKINALESLLA